MLALVFWFFFSKQYSFDSWSFFYILWWSILIVSWKQPRVTWEKDLWKYLWGVTSIMLSRRQTHLENMRRHFIGWALDGECMLSTSKHASIHCCLLWNMNVMWLASGSSHLDLPAVTDCNLELWVRANFWSLNCFHHVLLSEHQTIKLRCSYCVSLWASHPLLRWEWTPELALCRWTVLAVQVSPPWGAYVSCLPCPVVFGPFSSLAFSVLIAYSLHTVDCSLPLHLHWNRVHSYGRVSSLSVTHLLSTVKCLPRF